MIGTFGDSLLSVS